ncbi:hypothetical protein BAMA_18270 [Bacillus manliponensis]|uniref:Uncharacterized protein n=1 Tax=Bacillus manliponensis TaxID=574376 RepID=A0A073JSH8_9BACI|nr:hypothetical protein [Bacillus manliponensis]KEK17156.1 hypothetical protein BAMA_18270 [Bacillus manliponensis]
MLNLQNVSQVVLPTWVMEGVKNEFELMLKAREYINAARYPGYRIVSIRNGMASCEKEDS